MSDDEIRIACVSFLAHIEMRTEMGNGEGGGQ